MLNSRNPRGVGFKQPLRPVNRVVWCDVIERSIHYLSGLKDINGTPLLKTRRKTFVQGFIIAASSIRKLALSLFNEPINPFSYLLTYISYRKITSSYCFHASEEKMVLLIIPYSAIQISTKEHSFENSYCRIKAF